MKRSPLAVLFITIFIDLLGFGIIIPILPVIAKELHASSVEIGLIAGIYSLMNFLFSPFWGTLSDKIGRRPVILVSITVTMCAYFFFAFTNSLWMLLVSRVFAGIGSANISAAQAYIADVTNPENRAKSMGMLGAAFGLGFIFGPPLGGLLKALSGVGSVDMVGYVAAGFCFVNLGMAFFLLPESLKEKSERKRFSFKPITGLIIELRKPIIRELFWISFIYIAAFAMMQITAIILWQERYGLDEKQVGYTFAFIGVASAIVQGGLVGRLNSTFGEKKLLLYGAILMGIGLAIIPFMPVDKFVPYGLIPMAIICLANGCMSPSLTALISKNTLPEEQGQVLGSAIGFGSLARVAGPAVGGIIYDLDYRGPFVGGALLMFLCIYIANLMGRKYFV